MPITHVPLNPFFVLFAVSAPPPTPLHWIDWWAPFKQKTSIGTLDIHCLRVLSLHLSVSGYVSVCLPLSLSLRLSLPVYVSTSISVSVWFSLYHCACLLFSL